MRKLAVFLFLFGGCVGATDPSVSEVSGAVGEPMNGFPSPAERLGLMAINRARSDPATVKGAQSAMYPARPPVMWTLALNQSARFHAVNLELSDVTLMHTSACTLNTDVATSGCTGDPACACATPTPADCAMCAAVADPVNNDCGTKFGTRVGYFTAGTNVSVTGEVAAAGYKDPIATVDGWMDEAAGSDGHRKNLTDQGITSNTMGYGHTTGMKECYSPFDISDSGSIKNATIPKLPTAAVSPFAGNAGTFTFYATWADPTLGAPASIQAVVDGACTPMTLELGTDKLNATYKATAMLTAGCHTYWILARDAGGATLTYPTTGALTVAVGGSTACTADYMATAPAAACLGDGGVLPTPDAGTTGGGGASGGSGGSGGASGGSGGGSAGAGAGGAGGTSASGGAGGGPTSGSGGAAATGGSTGSGGAGTGGPGPKPEDGPAGCHCDASGATSPGALGAAGLLSLAALLSARRRPRALTNRSRR
jgi:hypothetical protein